MPAPYPAFDGTQWCASGNPERFFPTEDPPGPAGREALELCAGCGFRQPCLDYAMTHIVVGIWGGTTTADRGRLRRKAGARAVPLHDYAEPSVSDDRPLWKRVMEMWADGMRPVDIADQLGISVGSTNSMISRHRTDRKSA